MSQHDDSALLALPNEILSYVTFTIRDVVVHIQPFLFNVLFYDHCVITIAQILEFVISDATDLAQVSN